VDGVFIGRDGDSSVTVARLLVCRRFVELLEKPVITALPSLATKEELANISELLNEHSLVHEDMLDFFEHYPPRAHPMGILSSMVNTLRAFYPELRERDREEEMRLTFTRLLSKLRTLAAASYRISRGTAWFTPATI
jgi:citrate synthase